MRLFTSIAVALTLAIPQPAVAAAYSACWVTTVTNPSTLQPDQVTRCRISGGEIIDYGSDSAIPSVLYAQTGADITGQCWYYTSAPTSYVVITQYANGDADIGFDTDPANPGGIVAIGPTLPRCTSEPSPVADPAAEAWEYVNQYIHDPPTPDLNPRVGDGVTGLETFVGVGVPDEHTANLSSGGAALDVFIEVSAVFVEWGDGAADTYPPSGTALAGYPDGFASHVYDTKDENGLSLTVAYDWTARWRLTSGPWQALAVPNTTTTVVYPVAEIVATLTD